jgi:SAM-dependent methyltransferase
MPNSGEHEAKGYWASLPFAWYHADGLQRALVGGAIRQLRRRETIQSVFEFGCNVGRNLEQLRQHVDPALDLVGLDINEAAVADGRDRYHLDLRLGDESALDQFPIQRFDCSFTLSVLDHVPDVGLVLKTIAALKRITRKYLLFLEPFNGRNEPAEEGAQEGATLFNYYWDYPTLFRQLDLRLLNDIGYPLSHASPMRRAYRLYVVGVSPNAQGLGFRFTQRCRIHRIRSKWAHRLRVATPRPSVSGSPR